tara:strand:+ start:992 stop:2227 length:1236 start_codon:yes stop_codon:yes gene_type:complete
MAITRLTDFVTVATSKWTYGDSAFKYEGEVNQDHDTIYPLMVMTPPTSRMPDIYEGWEHYNVEMEFYNTYQTAAQNAVTLQLRWDNLQDLALEWLDNVLIEYSGGVIPNVSTSSPTPTQVYIDKESLQIERIKNNKNDKLCRITMRFDMRMFTRCFTPKSVYPNTISDLVVWLRADSNTTFNIPTKKVSTWGDSSGNNNNISQSSAGRQPFRYSYSPSSPIEPSGDYLDKTRITFPKPSTGLQPQYHFLSDSNSPISGNDFTIFIVANCIEATVHRPIYSYTDTGTGVSIKIGQGSADKFVALVTDESGKSITTIVITTNIESDNIFVTTLESDNLSVQNNNNSKVTNTTAGFNATALFNTQPFSIGGALGFAEGFWPEFDTPEILIYNKALLTSETNQVLDYLNNKYKIY